MMILDSGFLFGQPYVYNTKQHYMTSFTVNHDRISIYSGRTEYRLGLVNIVETVLQHTFK